MFNADTEILFPVRVIPSLRNLRGSEWQELVDSLTNLPDQSVEKIAFTAMIVHLGGCSGCNADSFRAMRGCTQCARLTIKRYKGTDKELLAVYTQFRTEVAQFLERHKRIDSVADNEL